MRTKNREFLNSIVHTTFITSPQVHFVFVVPLEITLKTNNNTKTKQERKKRTHNIRTHPLDGAYILLNTDF